MTGPVVRWSSKPTGPVVGFAVARESGHVLIAGADNWLNVLDRRGREQSKARWMEPVIAVAAADDGRTFAVADRAGSVRAASPDLRAGPPIALARAPTAVAAAPNGGAFAVADLGGQVTLISPSGDTGATLTAARPARSLAFVAESPRLAVAADFGLVAVADLAKPAWAWTDAPVVHTGNVAVSGDGSLTVLPCFSEGLRRYTANGRALPLVPTPESCRLAAVNYDGNAVLIAGAERTIYLLASDGTVRHRFDFTRTIAAVALMPLGDAAVVALADGAAVWLDFP